MKFLLLSIWLIAVPACADWDVSAIRADISNPTGYLASRPDIALELLDQVLFSYENKFNCSPWAEVEWWGKLRAATPVNNPSYKAIEGVYKALSDNALVE